MDRIATSARRIASTNDVLPGTDEFTLEDVLADEAAPDTVDDIDRAQVRGELERLIEELDTRDRKILAWRFGLGGGEPLTLEIIGRRLGLSRERVRQLEARALKRLREQPESRRLGASLEFPLDEVEHRDADREPGETGSGVESVSLH